MGVSVSDRRQFIRYKLAEDEFQLIHQDTDTIGWLTDIGHQGLSYEYIAIENQQADIEDIGLFSPKKRGMFLPGLSCKVVYDTTLVEESESYSVYNFRRRGLKYLNMTKEQKRRLKFLLNNLAKKTIESAGETKILYLRVNQP